MRNVQTIGNIISVGQTWWCPGSGESYEILGLRWLGPGFPYSAIVEVEGREFQLAYFLSNFITVPPFAHISAEERARV